MQGEPVSWQRLETANIEAFIADVPSWVALAQLVEDLRRQAVVPFLGAGVSQAIGYPGWNEAVLRLGRVSDPKLATLPSDPLFVADRFREALRHEADYLGFFRQEFACDEAKQARIQASELWRALAQLPCNSWVTMNYDSALEHALQKLAGRHPVPVDWSDRHGVNQLLLGPTPADAVRCVHLHGLVPLDAGAGTGRTADFVLTEQEYQRRYLRSDEDRSKLFVIFTSRVLLFIGCSLTDLDLMGVLREVKAKLGFRGHRHYALLASPANDKEREERNREKLRLKYGVEPIVFQNDDGRFAGLPAILHFLREAAANSAVLVLPEAVTRGIDDDPEKGRWGMAPARGKFRLSAAHVRTDGATVEVNLVVTGPGRRARFHLHPTFLGGPFEAAFVAGTATQPIEGWGAFTVGVEVFDEIGSVQPLELDLAGCEDLPWDFRSR